MARIIKFRCWDGKEMIFSNPMPNHSFWKYVAYDNTTPVMQFTGLHDKNGKEIYEGDVFKGDDDYNGAVEWDNKAWCWSINWGPNARDPFSDYHMTEFEVIGNIYENPDLLT